MPILGIMAENTTNLAKERAFSNAQSHSKRVRTVKRLLPILALGLVGVAGVTIFTSLPGSGVTLDLPSTTLSDGKLVMANPNLDGFTNDERPFRVTATRAIQDLAVQDALELEELVANVELEDGLSARLTSPTGMFNSNSNRLVLPNEAFLTTSDGMQATMGQADIDIQTGAVSATKSVKIINAESTITAETMQIDAGGKRIVFEENVRVVFQPQTNNSVTQNTQTSQTVSNDPDAGIN